MSFHRRKLPHWIPDRAIIFMTWRLAGSCPAESNAHHRGPLWLQDPRIAEVVRDALQYGELVRQLYSLNAWVIMPNHVHVILAPRVQMTTITRWLKGRTSRVANRVLQRTGRPFWQDKSFDHWIRTGEELRDLVRYVEGNPVKAKLVENEKDWPWSSATKMAGHEKRWPAPLGSN